MGKSRRRRRAAALSPSIVIVPECSASASGRPSPEHRGEGVAVGLNRRVGSIGGSTGDLEYTTDMDELLKNWATLTGRFDSRFATSLLGVTQLPAPQLLVMLEATAAD